MSHISISQLSKTYPGATPVQALDGIDLQVAQGEFIALLGPSGCGKSTLLNLVAGFEAPTAGRLQVGGSDIERPGPERGVVFQEAALFPWLNVWENVVFGPKIAGQPKSEYAARADERSEERRVGKEGVSTCRSRGSPDNYKKTKSNRKSTKRHKK